MYQVAKEVLELVVVFVDVFEVVGLCVIKTPPPPLPSAGPRKAAKNMNAVNNPIAFFYGDTI